jgi:uncharacterized protein YndB with AHSA1/START domain
MEVDVDGETRRFGGEIRVFDPGREITFDDNWIPAREWSVAVAITIRLTPSRGGTLVELFVHGFEAFGDAAAERHAGLEQGWTVRQLAALRTIAGT